jgi:hypothetical protein
MMGVVIRRTRRYGEAPFATPALRIRQSCGVDSARVTPRSAPKVDDVPYALQAIFAPKQAATKQEFNHEGHK